MLSGKRQIANFVKEDRPSLGALQNPRQFFIKANGDDIVVAEKLRVRIASRRGLRTLNGTNGFLLRGLWLWSARAITSFPNPSLPAIMT